MFSGGISSRLRLSAAIGSMLLVLGFFSATASLAFGESGGCAMSCCIASCASACCVPNGKDPANSMAESEGRSPSHTALVAGLRSPCPGGCTNGQSSFSAKKEKATKRPTTAFFSDVATGRYARSADVRHSGSSQKPGVPRAPPA